VGGEKKKRKNMDFSPSLTFLGFLFVLGEGRKKKRKKEGKGSMLAGKTAPHLSIPRLPFGGDRRKKGKRKEALILLYSKRSTTVKTLSKNEKGGGGKKKGKREVKPKAPVRKVFSLSLASSFSFHSPGRLHWEKGGREEKGKKKEERKGRESCSRAIV